MSLTTLQINRALGGESPLATANARLYIAESTTWSLAHEGLVALTQSHNGIYFHFLDITNGGAKLWQQRVYKGFQYYVDAPCFHSFEADSAVTAFAFADENQANLFHAKVKMLPIPPLVNSNSFSNSSATPFRRPSSAAPTPAPTPPPVPFTKPPAPPSMQPPSLPTVPPTPPPSTFPAPPTVPPPVPMNKPFVPPPMQPPSLPPVPSTPPHPIPPPAPMNKPPSTSSPMQAPRSLAPSPPASSTTSSRFANSVPFSQGLSFFSSSDSKSEKSKKEGSKFKPLTKSKSKKGGGIDKSMIGKPSEFRHVSGIQVAEDGQFVMGNIPEVWKDAMKEAGITEEMLRNKKTRNFIFRTLMNADKALKSQNAAALPPPPPLPSSSPLGSPSPSSARPLPPPPPSSRPSFPPPLPPSSPSIQYSSTINAPSPNAPSFSAPRAAPPPPPPFSPSAPTSFQHMMNAPRPPPPPPFMSSSRASGAPPPPPPPPPPPIPASFTSPPAPILKSTSPNPRPVEVSGANDRDSLLSSIRQFNKHSLAKADEEKSDTTPSATATSSTSNTTTTSGLASLLMDAMANRRMNFETDEDDDDDDENDEDWG